MAEKSGGREYYDYSPRKVEPQVDQDMLTYHKRRWIGNEIQDTRAVLRSSGKVQLFTQEGWGRPDLVNGGLVREVRSVTRRGSAERAFLNAYYPTLPRRIWRKLTGKVNS